MTIKPLIAAALLATSAIAMPAYADAHGEKHMKMKESKNIAETAMSVDDLSTLVSAVKAADLVPALTGDGPLTVFAPTNDAFAALPAGTVDMLLMPENKDKLAKILTSHVVAGSYDAKAITKMAKENDGKVELTTLSGAKLKAKLWDGTLYVKDENGGKASIAMADVDTSNGIVHVVSAVLLPK